MRKPSKYLRLITTFSIVAILISALPRASAQVTYPKRPGDREFIVDEANLITADDEAKIKSICDQLLTDTKAPIIVVTINSMADYGARNWQIERYAMNLFAEWGIGFEDWNYGVLLLVSKGDRRARIELGADWRYALDDDARRIMNNDIIPNFKRGDFSAGILAGVEALDQSLRAQRSKGTQESSSRATSQPPPSSPSSTRSGPPSGSSRSTIPYSEPGVSKPYSGAGIGSLICIAFSVVILIVILMSAAFGRARGGAGAYGGAGSLIDRPLGSRSGSGFGWGSFLFGGLLGALGSSLYHSSRHDRHSFFSSSSDDDDHHFGGGGGFGSFGGGFGGGSFGGGGGFSGGSGGGGFSGGGGATGSW